MCQIHGGLKFVLFCLAQVFSRDYNIPKIYKKRIRYGSN